jgi:small subunit ribosomal protein S9
LIEREGQQPENVENVDAAEGVPPGAAGSEAPAESAEKVAAAEPTPAAAEPAGAEAEPTPAAAEPAGAEAEPAEATESEPAPAAGESEEATPPDETPAPAEREQVRGLAELAAGARYFATGKRKSSVARVIVRPGSGQFVLNGRTLENYFPRRTHQAVVRQPLEVAGYGDRIDVRARIHGGGVSGQADAVRHGIAKALIEADPALRSELKRRQLLTRDPRVKERKKAGLKKARKRPQFSKR